MIFTETNEKIKPLDQKAMSACRTRIDSLAKPLGGLGRLETLLVQIAGITGSTDISLEKKGLIVMCADNGVTDEGVTQTDSSVTAVVANNFADGMTSACLMCRTAGIDVFPVDIGVKSDTKIYTDKIACGTKNIRYKPAMTMEETVRAIEVGIRMAQKLKEKGYRILLTGEMGIGNTTTSSAVASVLLGESVEKMTGRGAGLSDAGFLKKQSVIKEAIRVHKPDENRPLDVLSKVGGLDIAGLTGVFLGGAALSLPVVADGFISGTAALAAVRINPLVRDYIIPSHMSEEPGMKAVMQGLGLYPPLHLDMKLGEGTGAAALMPLIDMALNVYRNMPTFEGINIEAYTPFDEKEAK